MNVSVDRDSANRGTPTPNSPTSQAVAINTNSSSPAYQAFRILQVGFVVAPILAGLDKFSHLLVNWDQYVPSFVARLSPIGVHNLMAGTHNRFAPLYAESAWFAVTRSGRR